MTSRTPPERPSARDYARSLGHLAAGVALSALIYNLIRMAAWIAAGGNP